MVFEPRLTEEQYEFYYYYEGVEPRTQLTPVEIIYVVFTILPAVLGLCFNSIAIRIILKKCKFGKGIRMQLMNMAVADILCSIATLVSGIVEGISVLPIPYILEFCGSLVFVNSTLFQASLLSNTAICLERFVAVYFPLKMKEYRRRHVITVIIAIWILSVVTNIQWAVDVKVHADPYYNPEYACTTLIYLAPTEVQLTSNVVFYCLPVLIIVTFYTLISIKLIRRKGVGERHVQSHSTVNTRVRRYEIVGSIKLEILLQ